MNFAFTCLYQYFRKSGKNMRDDNGFHFKEVLVAIAILIIVTVVIYKLYITH